MLTPSNHCRMLFHSMILPCRIYTHDQPLTRVVSRYWVSGQLVLSSALFHRHILPPTSPNRLIFAVEPTDPPTTQQDSPRMNLTIPLPRHSQHPPPTAHTGRLLAEQMTKLAPDLWLARKQGWVVLIRTRPWHHPAIRPVHYPIPLHHRLAT